VPFPPESSEQETWADRVVIRGYPSSDDVTGSNLLPHSQVMPVICHFPALLHIMLLMLGDLV